MSLIDGLLSTLGTTRAEVQKKKDELVKKKPAFKVAASRKPKAVSPLKPTRRVAPERPIPGVRRPKLRGEPLKPLAREEVRKPFDFKSTRVDQGLRERKQPKKFASAVTRKPEELSLVKSITDLPRKGPLIDGKEIIPKFSFDLKTGERIPEQVKLSEPIKLIDPPGQSVSTVDRVFTMGINTLTDNLKEPELPTNSVSKVVLAGLDISFKQLASNIPKVGIILSNTLTELDAELNLGIWDPTPTNEKKLTDMLEESSKWWDGVLKKAQSKTADFTPAEQFATNVVSGGATIVTYLASSALFGGITTPFLLAAAERSPIYFEAIEAGRSHEQALKAFFNATTTSGTIDKVGMDFLLSSLPAGRWWQKTINVFIKGLAEGTQETLQDFTVDAVRNYSFGGEFASLEEYANTFAVASVVGAGSSVVVDFTTNDEAQKAKEGLVKEGFSEQDAEKLITEYSRSRVEQAGQAADSLNSSPGVASFKESMLIGKEGIPEKGVSRPGIEKPAQLPVVKPAPLPATKEELKALPSQSPSGKGGEQGFDTYVAEATKAAENFGIEIQKPLDFFELVMPDKFSKIPIGLEIKGLKDGKPVKGRVLLEGTELLPKAPLTKPKAVGIGAVGRAVGQEQASEYENQFQSKEYFKFVEKNKNITPELEDKYFNFIDQKKPISPSDLQKLGGQEFIDKTKEFQEFLTKEQEDVGALNTTIDDANYVRTFLVQQDGSDAKPSQIRSMISNTSRSMMKRLFGVNPAGSSFGLSKNNRYNTQRKFENADLRDKWLEQFGLKTDRRYFHVLKKTSQQVKALTSNIRFLDSLWKDAKLERGGVAVAFDPKEIKALREQALGTIRNERDKILDEARRKKILSEKDFKQAKENSKQVTDELRDVTKSALDTPPDIRKLITDDIKAMLQVTRKTLFSDLKKGRRRVNDLAEQRIEAMENSILRKYDQKLKEINTKIAKLEAQGFEPIVDPKLKMSLYGLMFTEKNTAALTELFKVEDETGGFVNNIVAVSRAMRMAKTVGDLFELWNAMVKIQGVSGLKGYARIWGFANKEDQLKTSKDGIEHGLLLEKPEELAVELTKRLGSPLPDKESPYISEVFVKLMEGLDKIPGVKQVKGVVGGAFQIVEDLQWHTVIPNIKLGLWNGLWVEIKAANEGMSTEEAKTASAGFVNDTIRGLNWKRLTAEGSLTTKILTKNTRKFTEIALFSVDKNAAFFRRVLGPVKGGVQGKFYRKFWMRQLLAGVGLLQLLNYLFTGHSTLENHGGPTAWFSVQIPQIKDEKGNPMQINPFGELFDAAKFVLKPAQFWKNKVGPLPRSLGIGQKEFFAPKTFSEWVWDNAPVPIAIQDFLDQAFNQDILPKTGEVDLKTAALQSGLEFIGLPTAFRSGASRQANLIDLVKGDATFKQYLTSMDLDSSAKRLIRSGEEFLDQTVEEKDASSMYQFLLTIEKEDVRRETAVELVGENLDELLKAIGPEGIDEIFYNIQLTEKKAANSINNAITYSQGTEQSKELFTKSSSEINEAMKAQFKKWKKADDFESFKAFIVGIRRTRRKPIVEFYDSL